MERSQRAQRVLLGAGLTAGLLALGFYVTGASPARAWSRLAPPAAPGGFVVIDGSQQGYQEVTLNGRPTRVLVCTHPGKSPREVLKHYARVAAAETPPKIPFVAEEADDGGSLVWVTPDGTRKAVLVGPIPGGVGSVFRLISVEGPSLQTGQPVPSRAPPPGEATLLPGGAIAPPGFRVGFCLTRPDGSGSAVLEARGACRDVAARLLDELERVGFSVEEQAAQALRAATPDTRLLLPLRHRSGSSSGHLAVSPSEDGARASLSVRVGR